jgi:class 3 adenylate cyclase/predicted ATPase
MRIDVRNWLETRGFGQFADLFESRQIDSDALPLLTDAHLNEMGVPVGPRVKLLAAIAELFGMPAVEFAGAERRRMTVVFVDLVGSTALSSRLDPEDLRDLIRSYQSAVAAEVSRYDGNVARYLGDGVLVYFGYPRAHEDDAERAVRAALSIVRVIAALRSPSGQPLAAHIGIATGLVVVGDLLGASAATERTVVGETPNLAARLVEIAAPGEIVVSAQTRALTRNVFDLRDLGPQSVKGLPAPVPAFSVLSERALATRFEAHHGAQLTMMVGRDDELALLIERWGRATRGRGQVVLLTGEAGIGKSRIVRALGDVIAAHPHVRIVNQCSPHHSDSALYPTIQQLTQTSGIGTVEGTEAKLDRLEGLLPGAASTEIGLIAALLGLDGSGRYGRLELTPEQQRARTFEALLNQIVRISKHQPIYWVLEDAHWIDPTTLELVTLCIDRVADLPALAVITARPDFKHDFGKRDHVTHILLGRLDRRQIAAMVSNVTRGKPVPDLVLGEIVAKTDGVPLFVEELTKAVLESGVLQETVDAFVLEGPLQRLSLPASLHDSMMARLDRHQPLKEVAQTAACIGREFEYGLLAAISSLPEPDLRDALARLEGAELIFRRGAVQEQQYLFKHALVRDAAYESLLKSKRQGIHARIVAALEGVPNTPPEILAQHATEAGFMEKAIDCWQRAGALAIARPAYQEAMSHANQALRLAEKMPDSRAWQERRLNLLLLLGQATIPWRGYSHSQTLAVFTRAQELVSAMGGAPQGFAVSYAMWVIYYVRGEHVKAFDVAQDICRIARREGNDSRMLTGLRALGISKMILGEPVTAHATFRQAEELAVVVHTQSRERRIAVAQRFGADPEIATQFHVALTLWALGYIDQATSLATRAVEAARAMGHVHTLGHALAHGAIVAVIARNADDALRLSLETIAFADEYDMDLWRGYGSILNAHAHVLAGDAMRAVPVMNRGLRHLERTQTGAMVPLHHSVHAYALAKVGRYEEAAREAALVRDELRWGTERYFWPGCLLWLADYLQLVPGNNDEAAEAAYTEALDHACRQGAVSWELCAAGRLARVWAEQGKGDKAADLLAPLLPRFTEGFGTPALREAIALLKSLRPVESRS